MGKRTAQENIVARPAYRAADDARRVDRAGTFLGPDAGLFASVLAHCHPGPRQRASAHLGLFFGEVEYAGPAPVQEYGRTTKVPVLSSFAAETGP